jgi:hypothetical protein
MWARIVECMIGCWLLMSPFIFGHRPERTSLWINDFAVGGLVIVIALSSHWRPTAWAHWLLLPIGAWQFAFGRLSQSPPLLPALQNEIIVGLLLIMFAIVPNEATMPPPAWRSRR